MDWESLKARSRLFNKDELTFEQKSEQELIIHSKHSLYRLGVWLEGFCTCYNLVYNEFKLYMPYRSKYFIEVVSK